MQVSPVGAVDLPGARIFVSSSSSGNVDGIPFTGGDILVYDSNDDSWAMFFDGSASGLGSANIDGFHILDATPGTTIIDMSFTGLVTVPGIGSVDDSDVVRWDEAQNSHELRVDGSDVGLTSGGEDIDALAGIDEGYAISTLGTGSIPATGGGTLRVTDEDLVELAGTFGDPTTGTFAPLLDSSDVGFTGDLVSAWVDPGTNEIFGSALNGYNIGGLTGDGDDIVVFTGTTGDPSSGTFALFWDGDANRFGGEQIDGLFIEPGTPPPPGSADLILTSSSDRNGAVAGDTVTYTIDVLNDGPDTAVNVVATNTLPAGLTFVSTSGCALDPNGLPCSLGDLAPNDSTSFTIVTTVDQGTLGTVENTFEVTSSTADPNLADNSATSPILVSGPPTAVDDGPASSSVPGDDYHTDIFTQLDLAAPGLLANDELGSPDATIVSYGGGDIGGSVTDYPTNNDLGFSGDGYIELDPDGELEFIPPSDFAGPFTFDYRLENEGGFSDATVTIYVGPRPVVMGGDLIYLSTAGSGTVDGITFEDEDVLVYDSGVDTWALFIDGSDLGLGTADIDGFALRADGSILMSLTAPRTIPGVGPTDDSDILLFTPTSTGETTAGTFSLFVDGSDLALTAGGEDIDSVTEYGEGDVAISTFGAFNVGGGVAGLDEDLIALGLTGTGSATSGNPSILFDGSDVDFQAEDISGASIDPDSNVFYLANLGNFNIPGLTGDGDDIIAYSGSPGPDTSGTFSTFFAGEDARFDNNQIDALHVAQGDSGPPNTPPRILNEETEFEFPEYFPESATEVLFEDDEDDEDDLTLTLGGPDASAFFLIEGVVLLLLPVQDFENPTDANGDGVYEVEAIVTDSGGLSTTRTFAFTVTDVEPDPVQFEALIGDYEADTIEGAILVEPGEEIPLILVIQERIEDFPVFWIDASVNGENVSGSVVEFCEELPEVVDEEALCVLPVTAADAPDGAELEVTVTLQLVTAPGDFPELDPLLRATFTDSAWYRTNEAPVIDETTITASVPEGQTLATDIDATDDVDSEGDGLTYSLAPDSPDNDLFSIDATTGGLTFNDPPDFDNPQDDDGDNIYRPTVRVTDSNGFTDTADVAITVTEVDEPPVITTPGPFDVAENQLGSVDINSSDDPDVTYTIGGDDGFLFDIDSATGVVSFKDAPDYENPADEGEQNTYDIRVTATDSGNLSGFADIVINVTNEVEQATIGDFVWHDINENGIQDDGEPGVQGVTVFLTNTTTSEQVQDVTDSNGFYSFTVDPGEYVLCPCGNVPPGGALTSPNEGDDDTGDSDFNQTFPPLTVTLADDEVNNDLDAGFTLPPVNTAPEITNAGDSSVAERQLNAVDVEATDDNDSEAGGTLTYSIGAGAEDGALLDIDATTGVVTFKTAPDFENPIDSGGDNTYTVMVRVTDSGGLFDEEIFTINITDVEEDPVITTTGPLNADENQLVVVDINATDDVDSEANTTLVYSLDTNAADDNGLLSIDADTGVVSFNTAPDHESPIDGGTDNTYTFTVRVTDSEGNFDEETFTVTINDLVEQATIGDRVWNDIDENGLQDDGETGRVGVTVNLIDPVEDAVIETDTTVAGGLYGFTVDPGDYIVEFVAPADTAFTVPFADPNPTIDSDAAVANGRTGTITVVDDEDNTSVDAGLIDASNQAPTLNSGSLEVDEGSSFVDDLNGDDDNDEEGDGLVFTITGGADGSFFIIDEDTGALSFEGEPDFENPDDNDGDNEYEVEVTLTDSGGLEAVELLTVTVLNLNEAPTVGPQFFTIAEDAADGEPVGVITASDPENDSLVFSLDDESDIAIEANSGALSVAAGANLVGGSPITLTVTAEDPSGLQDSATITVTVTNVNRPPVVNAQGFNVPEDSAAGTVIGTVAASDPDFDSVTFALGDSSQVAIDPISGELTVVDIASVESGDDIMVTVTVTDPGLLTDTATLTIGVGSITIGLDTVISGEIDPSGDKDSYSFAASAGLQLYFDVLDPGAGCAGWAWTLISPTDNVVFDANIFGCANDIELTLTETGEYTLVYDGRDDQTGDYQFEIVTVPVDIPTAINVDEVVDGDITVRGETDTYTFNGTSGDMLYFDTIDPAATNCGGYAWKLTSEIGTEVFEANIFGCGNDIELTLPETGEYTLVYDGRGEQTGPYRFEIVSVPVDIPTAINVDEVVDGDITVRGETDTYTFNATAGDELLFDLLDTGSGCGGFAWRLTSEIGTEMFDANIFGCTNDIEITLPETGEYTLVFDGRGAQTGPYRFEITTVLPPP
ncbi:MAG: SdrD B-like domain-containing protein [Acidimicrobiales bacterium]